MSREIENVLAALDGFRMCDQMDYAAYSQLHDMISMLDVPDKNVRSKFGKWKQTHAGMTPGGTPLFVCERCGGSDHLHGAEYPKRKVICDNCGQINIYPWEKAYEEGSSLWPTNEQREVTPWE